MADKLTRKELKEPDKLQVAYWKLVDYVNRNRNKALLVSLGALTCILALSAWLIYSDRYDRAAREKYAIAFEYDLQGGIRASEHAIRGYRELIDTYPRSPVAKLAHFRLGGLHHELGNYADAVAAYSKFLETGFPDKHLRFMAYIGMGYAYEAKKDYPKALEAFQKAMAEGPGDRLAMIGYRNIARLYEITGDIAQAAEHYQKALKKAQNPEEELFLRRKLSELR